MEAFDVQRENDPPDRFLIRLTFLDRAVPLPGSGLPADRERDALDLAIRPGMLDPGQPVVI